MIIYALQILITLVCTAIYSMSAYNAISDPMEKASGQNYSERLFLKQNAVNIAKFWLCGVLVLVALNEGGMRLIDLILKISAQTQIAELLTKNEVVLGDMLVAILSGMYGQKIIDKLT